MNPTRACEECGRYPRGEHCFALWAKLKEFGVTCWRPVGVLQVWDERVV